MSSAYVIGGVRLRRQSLIKLSHAEREAVRAVGRATLYRPVAWPLVDRVPDFANAYVDPGGTDLWGEGPYLKVPNQARDDAEHLLVNRVFCPWGYPPSRVRVSWSTVYLQLESVALSRSS